MRSCNYGYSGRAMSLTHSESVYVALSIQNAMRLLHIAVCSLPCSAFSTLSHKQHEFQKH